MSVISRQRLVQTALWCILAAESLTTYSAKTWEPTAKITHSPITPKDSKSKSRRSRGRSEAALSKQVTSLPGAGKKPGCSSCSV